MNNNNIAIIDHVGSKAGMDYYSYFLAKGIFENGSQVLIVSNFTTENPNIKCYNIFDGHRSSLFRKISNHFWAFIKAATICKRNKCSSVIIHLFSYQLKDFYALFILKIFNLKITAIVHDIEGFAFSDLEFIKKIIFRKLTDNLVVHNQFSYDVLISRYNDLVLNKTKIIPHGNFHNLPNISISKSDARLYFSMAPELNYLLFFGQIKEVKGLDILLKSLVYMPDTIRLVIAGKPWKNDFNQYQLMIDDLGIRHKIIQHIGFVSDIEREFLFKACDILILPYKHIFQSGVLLMAMSYKIPIIASDLLPMKEMIKNGETGFLFKNGDELSLAKKVKEALLDKELLSTIALNAWNETDKNNNWNKIASEHIAL